LTETFVFLVEILMLMMLHLDAEYRFVASLLQIINCNFEGLVTL